MLSLMCLVKARELSRKHKVAFKSLKMDEGTFLKLRVKWWAWVLVGAMDTHTFLIVDNMAINGQNCQD